jgi:hypothetical protein
MIVLRNGSRGPDVAAWQRFLTTQLLLDGDVDGVFGAQTDDATRRFQAREKLTVDGVVGAKTLTRASALGAPVFRRLRNEEVTPALSEFAKAVLREHSREALGREFPLESGGRSYFARLEEHYHPPGGTMRPWGYHTGVSLFVFVEVGPEEPVHEPVGTPA